MRFGSRRDSFVNIIIYGTIAILILPLITLLKGEINMASVVIILFCLAFIGLLLWILYGTYYIIGDTHINYYSGPIRGSIEIEKIQTLRIGKNLYAGLRPATALNGLVVRYGKYDEIYFSPNTNEDFTRALLKKKPNIIVEK